MTFLRSLKDSIEINDENTFYLIKKIEQSQLNHKLEKSFFSLKLRYFIKNKMTNDIYTLFASGMEKSNLMKRDCISYCIYIYDINRTQAVFIFKNHVVANEIIFDSDIKLLIENNCYDLIKQLDRYFINCNLENNFFDFIILKDYIPEKKEGILLYYQKIIGDDIFSRYISRLNTVDVIIDGGNVCHYGNKGKPNYSFLEIMMKMISKKFKNPLIIFNQRHLKRLKELKPYSDNIFSTPYGVYDDYFLIAGLINNNIPIISNDNFKDHIFDMYQLFDCKSNFVKNYISSKTLTYTNKKISPPSIFTKCVQVIGDEIIIPTTTNGFHKIESQTI